MNTSILLREAIEVEERWPTIGAHNLNVKVPLPQLRALIAVSQAAYLFKDSPSDQRLRQLADALDALEIA